MFNTAAACDGQCGFSANDSSDVCVVPSVCLKQHPACFLISFICIFFSAYFIAGGCEDWKWPHQFESGRSGWICGPVQNQKAHPPQQTDESILRKTGETSAWAPVILRSALVKHCTSSVMLISRTITWIFFSGFIHKANTVQVWWSANQWDRHTCTGLSFIVAFVVTVVSSSVWKWSLLNKQICSLAMVTF